MKVQVEAVLQHCLPGLANPGAAVPRVSWQLRRELAESHWLELPPWEGHFGGPIVKLAGFEGNIFTQVGGPVQQCLLLSLECPTAGLLELTPLWGHCGGPIVKLADFEGYILDVQVEAVLQWCLPGLASPGAAVPRAGWQHGVSLRRAIGCAGRLLAARCGATSGRRAARTATGTTGPCTATSKW